MQNTLNNNNQYGNHDEMFGPILGPIVGAALSVSTPAHGEILSEIGGRQNG